MPISNGKYYNENDPEYIARVTAALNAPVTGQPYVPTPASPVVTPESLAPATPINYVNPNRDMFNPSFPTPVTPVEKVETPKTDEVSKMIADLTASSGLGGEKTAYQLEQEKGAGLEAMRKTEADYTYQYKQLENEFKNLQIESQKVPYRVEGEFTGRAGVYQQDVMTRARQRDITLKSLDVSARANTVNALLLGQQGLIDSAQKAVDRAVSDKFAVREAERKTKLENLDLLLKDPKIDQETKDKAAAVAAKIKEQGEIDAQKKIDMAAVLTTATNAAANGAKTDVINRIASAKTPVEALQIAAENNVTITKTLPAIAQEYNFAVDKGYTGTFIQYQNEDANRKAVVAKAAVNGLPYQVTAQVDKLSSGFDSAPIVKNYNETQNKKLSVDSILASGIKGPADLALVFDFMKALDPTSVVRESEYDTASKSGNIFMGWAAKFNGYLKEGGGFLPEQVRKDFQSIINQKFNIATQQYNNLRSETARKINIKTGMKDGAEYLTDYAATLQNQQNNPLNLPVNNQSNNPLGI